MGAREPAPSPALPANGNSISANTCSLYIFLLFFFVLWGGLGGEGIGGGWHFPLPLSLRTKGMQLVRRQFLEQYGWGEKVITCLGFHCGNGCTFHRETLVSGGDLRGRSEGEAGAKGQKKVCKPKREERERRDFFFCM